MAPDLTDASTGEAGAAAVRSGVDPHHSARSRDDNLSSHRMIFFPD
ncbi:MAG: hypothetical protein ACYS32_07585 [Planctomycetota bacterium]